MIWPNRAVLKCRKVSAFSYYRLTLIFVSDWWSSHTAFASKCFNLASPKLWYANFLSIYLHWYPVLPRWLLRHAQVLLHWWTQFIRDFYSHLLSCVTRLVHIAYVKYHTGSCLSLLLNGNLKESQADDGSLVGLKTKSHSPIIPSTTFQSPVLSAHMLRALHNFQLIAKPKNQYAII